MTKDPAGDAGNLFEALYDGENAVVRALRAGASAESSDTDGTTALYLASVEDLPGAVRLLLAAGADPNRASGPEAGDLPLCGAACGGHGEVVEALLAAGAEPDLREEFGFTALRWAVGLGHARIAETLLSHGADPGLPGPEGESPLVLAARRGSVHTVRTLLRHGAADLARALEEARRCLRLDIERELRDALSALYGDGAGSGGIDGGFTTVVRRTPVDGGVTVTVELRRDGEPFASQDRQTGHGAIATLLENELGLRAPFEELAARALRGADPELDDWHESVEALWLRGDEETFQAAAAWTASGDPLRQAFGADVLAQLGFRTGAKPFAARSVPLLRELAREAVDAELIQSAVLGLGHHEDPAALPEILRHAEHPDRSVRRAVTLALFGPAATDRPEAVAALITLSGDTDEGVRDWATTALAAADDDTAEIREALAVRLDDADPDTVAEAARGLARRGDPRAAEALARLLAEEPADSYAGTTAAAAMEDVPGT
ncbi:ankyrin repeat domain-containing protein [Streptomyces sp. NBC_00683]|uniref:ankyrin repeat domain-containing protein n=1 Tax=Streptomyces sp. NBC_00683 TaxID=2903670 RepID=UPI002E330147|nr:ankyrin repeat domain-containing protein [Streptomyces sp. NBC_00683]